MRKNGMTSRATLLCTMLLLAMSAFLPGCALCGRWFDRNPYAMHAPCLLPPEIPLADLVRHLNGNITRLTAWRAVNVEISLRGTAVLIPSLSAMLAVETPRNFRLTAGTWTNREVDLGSNQEQFWFWSRQSEEKYVFTARHDQMARAQQVFPIPFQPDWLIEALGVIPIDESEVVLEPNPSDSRRVNLVSHRVSPRGEPVRKVIVVDTCHGLILEHVLLDSGGRLIARAVLSGHYRDPASGVVLPARIDFDWPQAKLALGLKLGLVEVNPASLPTQTWTLPEIPGYPPLDLGR